MASLPLQPDQNRAPQKAVPNRWAPFVALAQKQPFFCFFLLILLSNGFGSFFNIAYNNYLIIRYLDASQKKAFWDWVTPAYNAVAYPVCLGIFFYLMRPLSICLRDLRAGNPIRPAHLEHCRRLLVNLPVYEVLLNLLGWGPGAILFPLGICLLGDWNNAVYLWVQFLISFFGSTLITVTQTFFILESFLIRNVYPDFFQDARPGDVFGAYRPSFGFRMLWLWWAVAFVPLLSLLAVALNVSDGGLGLYQDLRILAIMVMAVGAVSSALISAMTGRNLRRWLQAHMAATERIAMGDFEVRVHELRPDEWGKLTDHFNEMAGALGIARYVRETFGQMVHPRVRDEILQRYPGLGGEVQEITVLFADIRGFTQRSAGESPDRAVELLNRFLSLAVAAVEGQGGWVNKFLGDGIMALFGAPLELEDQADRALGAAQNMLARLEKLNTLLTAEGQAGLAIGVGIHTGPALVGCVGATLETSDRHVQVRREFTAIGETVNLAQRVEQLTKTHGGPILISGQTRSRLKNPFPLIDLGLQSVPGFQGKLTLFRVNPPDFPLLPPG